MKKKPFNIEELKSIRRVISDAREFQAAYIHHEALREAGLDNLNPELDRFFADVAKSKGHRGCFAVAVGPTSWHLNTPARPQVP